MKYSTILQFLIIGLFLFTSCLLKGQDVDTEKVDVENKVKNHFKITTLKS